MLTLKLIGIGTGNPEHLTLQAIRELRACDLILIPQKGEEKGELAQLRRDICKTHLAGTTRLVAFDMPERDPAIASYRERVERWHDAIAARWMDAITAHGAEHASVGLLVWGDPSLFDSTIRIADRLAARIDMQVVVIPGITALQGLTAAHGIPINEIGEAFVVTTGRKLREDGWPAGADTVAIMLDGECSFQSVEPAGVTIWWGAYVGMPQEITLSGPLAELREDIVDARGQARAQHGWIMDSYVLKRHAAGK